MTESSTTPPPPRTEAEEAAWLASIGMTNADIAVLLECSEAELTSRYGALMSKARARMHRSILSIQFKLAYEGNVTLLMWLGRNYLGQSGEVVAAAEDVEPRMVFVGLPAI